VYSTVICIGSPGTTASNCSVQVNNPLGERVILGTVTGDHVPSVIGVPYLSVMANVALPAIPSIPVNPTCTLPLTKICVSPSTGCFGSTLKDKIISS
jgi:hypothetical protein